MNTQDRRDGADRRTTDRFAVSIEVEWETSSTRQPGAMSDVSFDGCFILSSGEVEDGEIAKVFIPLEDGMKVQFDGKVANHVHEIGFGVKFDPLSSAQRSLLVALVRKAEEA